MKAKKVIFIILSSLVIVQVFLIDVVLKSLGPESIGLYTIKQFLLISEIALFYLIINKIESKIERNSVSKIGILLILTAAILVIFGLLSFIPGIKFDLSSQYIIALNYFTVIISNIFSTLIIFISVYFFVILKNFILSYRRKSTIRNFILLCISISLTSLTYFYTGVGKSTSFSMLLMVISIILMLIHSFRLPWVIYLSRKEKYYTIGYLILLCPMIIFLVVVLGSSSNINSPVGVLYYSSSIVRELVFNIFLFGTIYLNVAFISTIFHLPTQDIFDKKLVEISSLHNLSRLVTQAFDFRDLIEEINKLSLTVCDGSCTWIEIKNKKNNSGFYIAGSKNISLDEINELYSNSEFKISEEVKNNKKLVYLENINSKLLSNENLSKKIKSLIAFPLISHSDLIGIIYIGSNQQYGFDKEYFNIITTFADQVTISLENAELLEKSFEKERIERELLLAQKMQQKLLPQKFPEHPNLDIYAFTLPAYEVGGDFYDFSTINENKIGIILGDVSGKGISAAFYMSLIKGMFQALSKIYESPKELLININKSIYGIIDKNSFVSLIYGVLDLIKGKLYLSRAGHCPMIWISNSNIQQIKPKGIGVGLDSGDIFTNTIEEIELQLNSNDVCVLYTDGITEARNKKNEEFGLEKFIQLILNNYNNKTFTICNNLIDEVKSFTEQDTQFDDITLVVFKWKNFEQN